MFLALLIAGHLLLPGYKPVAVLHEQYLPAGTLTWPRTDGIELSTPEARGIELTVPAVQPIATFNVRTED